MFVPSKELASLQRRQNILAKWFRLVSSALKRTEDKSTIYVRGNMIIV